jgi:hypothetical protein
MAIASFLTPADVLANPSVYRVSSASIGDIQYYGPAAYRRMEQVFKGEQDGQIITQMFPRASIELLLMFEDAWWPSYITKAARTTLWSVKQDEPGKGMLMTGFVPANLVRANQWLVEVEVYLVIAKFYETLINDNANINEKDKFNWKIARERFHDRWSDIMQASHFYDVNTDGFISKIEENNDTDINYYSEDRRYF